MLSNSQVVGFIPITDSARARAFYEGILKLQFESENEYSVVVRGNGTEIRLFKLDEFTPSEHTVLGWETEDIAAAVRALKAAGVKMERYDFIEHDELGIWRSDGSAIAWFKDPDGNVLSVAHHDPVPAAKS